MLEKFSVGMKSLGDAIKAYMTPIIVVVGLLVAWQAWGAIQKYLNQQTQAKIEETKKLTEQIEKLNQETATLKAEKKVLTDQNTQYAADVAKWKAEASKHPAPAPVGHPPQDIQQAVDEVSVSGVKFTLSVPKLGDDPYKLGTLSTEAKNTPTIWTWYKESLRVPGLETAYNTQVGLTSSLSTQVNGLQLEVAKDNQIIQKHEEEKKVSAEKTANLEIIVKDTQKAVKREKFNGNVKAIAAFVLGWFVHKGVTK